MSLHARCGSARFWGGGWEGASWNSEPVLATASRAKQLIRGRGSDEEGTFRLNNFCDVEGPTEEVVQSS